MLLCRLQSESLGENFNRTGKIAKEFSVCFDRDLLAGSNLHTASLKAAYPGEVDVFSEVDFRKAGQSGRNALFVNEEDIKSTVVDFRSRSKVHPSSGKSAVTHNDAEQRVGDLLRMVDFNSDDLFAMTSGRRNGSDPKSQESAHPLVVSLKALNDDGRNPLLAFVKKQLLTLLPFRIDAGHLAEIYAAVNIPAGHIYLLICSLRKTEAPDGVMSRPTPDDSQPAWRIA